MYVWGYLTVPATGPKIFFAVNLQKIIEDFL